MCIAVFAACISLWTVGAQTVSSAVNEVSTDGTSDSVVLEDESSIVLNASDSAEQPGRRGSNALSTVWVFLRMVLVLAIVLAVIWIIFKLLKQTTDKTDTSDQFLRKVASITISPGKSVQVVTLVDRAFLIGVADGSISLLAEIDDEEMINAMNLHADRMANAPRPKNFSEVLEMFMPKKNIQPVRREKSKNAFNDGNAEQILASLKKQSERMNREDEQ